MVPISGIRRIPVDEEGSILPLLAVFTAVALAVILTVAAAGSLYLERKRLLTVADGAALAAAESFDLGEAALGVDGVVPQLEADEARSAASVFLAGDPDPRTSSVRLVTVDVDDGRSATVVVAATWRPPMLTPFLPDGVALEARSTARSVFR